MHRPVADLRQGRRRERNITVETQKGLPFCIAAGLLSEPSLGCRASALAKDYERSLESSVAWAQLAARRFMMRRIGRSISC